MGAINAAIAPSFDLIQQLLKILAKWCECIKTAY